MEKIDASDSWYKNPNISKLDSDFPRSRAGRKKAMYWVNPTAREAAEPEKVTKKLAHPDKKASGEPYASFKVDVVATGEGQANAEFGTAECPGQGEETADKPD